MSAVAGQPAAVAWDRLGARVCAALDVGPVFLYAAHHSPVASYPLTLTAKLLYVILARVDLAARLNRVWPALAYVAFIALFDLAWLNAPAADAAQVLGFCAEMGLTLAIVKREWLRDYLAVYAIAILANFAVYLLEVLRGGIALHYSRYFYFDYLQPNLGSEIAAAGTVCAALALSPRLFALAWTLEAVSIGLMQGRSALLVSGGVLAVMGARLAAGLTRRHRFAGLALICAAGIAGLAALAELARGLTASVRALLLLDDPNRGGTSGFSGRTEGWHDAYEAFLRHPFTGAGIGYFDNPAIWPPHNLVLFYLSQFGMLSVPMMVFIVVKYRRLMKLDRGWFLLWVQFLPLLFFNDRVFNLNPYPYVFYVVLLAI